MKETFWMFLAVFLVLLAFQPCSCGESKAKNKMFFLQDKAEENGSSKLLVVTWVNDEAPEGCEVFTDQNLIKEVLDSAQNPDIQITKEDEIQEILKDCTEVTARKRRQSGNEARTNRRAERPRRANRTTERPRYDDEAGETTTESNEETTTEGYSGRPVIFPGTKWCGAGNIAENYDDLGMNEDTDKCCRAHDNCDDIMAPGETKYNLTNDSKFTKLNCQCDDEFHDCLEKTNSMVSNSIGNTYFNILNRECYKYDHPEGKCKSYRSFLKITCKEYEKNTTQPKTWQFVGPRRYKTLPIPGPLTITVDF